MMKSKDCSVATALIIRGFLHANEVGQCGAADCFAGNNKQLADCLSAIRQECHDWAENLPVVAPDENAIEPEPFTLDLMVGSAAAPRSPYNLISAAISLVREAVDLSGPGVVGDFHQRLAAKVARPKVAGPPALPAEQQLLVDAANELVAEIDAATDRPVLKLAVFDNLCAQLRGQGVDVIDRVVAPANW